MRDEVRGKNVNKEKFRVPACKLKFSPKSCGQMKNI
jgi:hypothetical protein